MVSLLASASFAGSLVTAEEEPIVEVIEDDDNGSGGLLLPLVAQVALDTLVSSESSADTTPP